MRQAIRFAAILAALSLFPSTANAVTINQCQAGKSRCVSKSVGCLLACYAKAEEVGVLDHQCVLRCKQKFDGNLRVPSDATKGCIQKLEARGGCLTADDTDAMAARVDGFVDAVVCDLDASIGTCAAPCGAGADCGVAGSPTPNATPVVVPGPKHVFLSSTQVTANLGGLSDADAVCQSLADSAGLGGRYRAWLSDGSNGPSTRFTRATGAYVLVDDVTTVANDWADLVDGTLASAILQTESGTDLRNVDVWTGTLSNGQPGGTSCFGWTSVDPFENALVGVAAPGQPTSWTQYETLPCDASAHLYCVEQ